VAAMAISFQEPSLYVNCKASSLSAQSLGSPLAQLLNEKGSPVTHYQLAEGFSSNVVGSSKG